MSRISALNQDWAGKGHECSKSVQYVSPTALPISTRSVHLLSCASHLPSPAAREPRPGVGLPPGLGPGLCPGLELPLRTGRRPRGLGLRVRQPFRANRPEGDVLRIRRSSRGLRGSCAGGSIASSMVNCSGVQVLAQPHRPSVGPQSLPVTVRTQRPPITASRTAVTTSPGESEGSHSQPQKVGLQSQ